MDRLKDDVLISIFTRLYRSDDRRSFSQVSKQFLKAACISLLKLRISLPDLLHDILPASLNLVSFECSKPLSNTHIKLLAHSCPNLRYLKLALDQNSDSQSNSIADEHDFNDDGVCAAANACIRLYEVSLSRRVRVGDVGVAALVRSCKNLTILELDGCVNVTDESLKSIGDQACRLENLSLQGCYEITDSGLAYLTNGNVRNCLRKLVLAECNRISDDGIMFLTQLPHLTYLNLSKCGVNVTDYGVWALTDQNTNIEKLNLSWLINVTDISLFGIAREFRKLRVICLTGCKAITGEGLRAFASYRTLEELELFSCDKFSWEDVELVLFTCMKLGYLGVSRKIKKMLPEEIDDEFFDKIKECCRVEWEE